MLCIILRRIEYGPDDGKNSSAFDFASASVLKITIYNTQTSDEYSIRAFGPMRTNAYVVKLLNSC